MQNWFSFSDRQMEDALYEIESIRRFAKFNSVLDALPDETTILNFRHLSFLQNSGWMSGNPTLSLFSGWNELHGGSMERNSSLGMGRSGDAGRRSRVLQEAHLLESHKLIEKLLEAINSRLKEQGLLVSQGTMVDATIIHAPSSTKNRDKARDPNGANLRSFMQYFQRFSLPLFHAFVERRIGFHFIVKNPTLSGLANQFYSVLR